jgi:hypothetical protein
VSPKKSDPRNREATDLRRLVDESERGFYLERKASRHLRLNLHRLEALRIHIGVPHDLWLEPVVVGFLVGRDGSGIVHVRGRIDSIERTGAVYDVAPVEIEPSSIVEENRREFFRCRFDRPPEAVLTPGTGASFRAQVLDLSAGGVKIRCGERLAVGDRIQVAFAPSTGSETRRFEFDCEVVSRLEAEQPTYGLQIVLPVAPTPAELKRFEELQRRIIRFCNDAMLHRARLLEEVL